MDTDLENILQEVESKLIGFGLSKEAARKQAEQLSELIVLSAIERLLAKKGVEPKQLSNLGPAAQRNFLKDKFSDEEIAQALDEEAERQVRDYLSAINQAV